MEKYKICPNPTCGKHNKPTAIECIWCETDLSGVKPTDDTTEAARAQAENTQSGNGPDSAVPGSTRNTGKMVRICEACGTPNPPNARKCSSCSEDISDVAPTFDTGCGECQQIDQEKRYILSSLDGILSFDVPVGKTLIGREEVLRDYLQSKAYVSRKHAELVFEDGVLSIINMSKTNFTYVNNDKITDNNPVVLKDGDEIGLGGNITQDERQEQAAYFRVKVV